MIHHIAIQTPNILKMREFYIRLPGLKFIQDHYYEDQKLRSSWFSAGSSLIMLESGSIKKASHALVFSIKTDDNTLDITNILPLVTHKTNYTIYLNDFDLNLIGYSTYPDSLTNIIQF